MDGYVGRVTYSSGNIRKTVKLHRILLHAPEGSEVDHINGNTLDNRRNNLRLTVRKYNAMNRKRHKNNTSGFRGVCRNTSGWQAQIKTGKRTLYLGTYGTRVEAALIRIWAETEIFRSYRREIYE
jgi:hypothetical protein